MPSITRGVVIFIVAFSVVFILLTLFSIFKPTNELFTATKDNASKPDTMMPAVAEELKNIVQPTNETPDPSPNKSSTRSFTVPSSQQSPPTEAHEKIKSIFEKLPSASIAFNNLREASVGKSFTMQFVVTFGDGEDKAGRLISSPGNVETSTIKVSDRLKVLLSCDKDHFSVNEMTEPVQLIYPGSAAYWSWSVTPLKSGDSALVLNVYALVDVGSTEKPLLIQTYKKELQVRSTVSSVISSITWLDKLIQSAISGIFIALFGNGFIKLFKRKSKESSYKICGDD